MDFQKEKRINYDPHHIISQRKKSNKNKPFNHQIVEGLDKIANLSYFEENSGIDEDRSNELTATVQAPDNPNILNKRSLSETVAWMWMKTFHIKISKHTLKIIKF